MVATGTLVRCALVIIFFTDVSSVLADQMRIRSIAEAKRLLWTTLYAQGGETLYCAVPFTRRADTRTEYNVEHIVPRDALEQLCPDHRRTCDRYTLAAADLHNLWPTLAKANNARSNYPFAEIPGESHRILPNLCKDFERAKLGREYSVEPRDEVKGEVARSILYMQREYGLTIRESHDMLLRWHRADPPSTFERRRNDIIERLQGTRNPYIDEPT